jgi:hypothetical protein
MKARILILVACVSLVAAAALAHGGEEHVIGTVTKVSQSSVTVQTAAKASVEVMITADTKFTRGSESVTPKDLQVGDRVVIHAMTMKSGMLMAHTVQIGVAKTSPKSH